MSNAFRRRRSTRRARQLAGALCALCLASTAIAGWAQPLPGPPSGGGSGPCTQASIALTLTWDALGDDFELHLVRPGGRLNDDESDCTWTSCIASSPDWGVPGDPRDDPVKDVDNTGAFGPEHICLAAPEPGRYTVLVEHWSGSGSPLADGVVELVVSGVVSVSEVADLPPHHVWRAATIDWPSGAVTVSTEVVDCTQDWSGGCQLPLP